MSEFIEDYQEELHTKDINFIKMHIFRQVYRELTMIDERKGAIRYRVTAPPINFDDFFDDISIGMNKTGFSGGKNMFAALSPPKREITSALSNAGSPRANLNKTVQIAATPS